MRKAIAQTGMILLGLLCLIYALQPVQADTYSYSSYSGSGCSTCGYNAPSYRYANLYVHVTDCFDGRAIYSAEVSVSGNVYRTAYTSGSGLAYFGSLPLYYSGSSSYQITVSKHDYKYKVGTASISCSQTYHTYVCLNRQEVAPPLPEPIPKPIPTPIPKEHRCRLNVNVYDSIHNPFEGSIYIDGSYAKTGSFYALDVAPGSHKVEARAVNYDGDYENVECHSDEAINVDLTLSKQQCTIQVRVMDSTLGSAIQEAIVTLDSANQMTWENGIATYGGLAPGNHRITAAKEGYTSASANVACAGGENKTVDVFLKDMKGDLKVHVKDCSNGDLIEGADVDLVGVGTNENGITNEYGYAYFLELATGSYEVSAKKDGFESNYQNNVRVNEGQMAVAEVCLRKTTNDDGNNEPQNCRIRVHTRDEHGNAISANIYVDGTYKGYGDYLTVTIDSGSHDVEATRSGYNSETKSVDCGDGETVDVYMDLVEENNDNEQNCRIRVHVRNEDDDAIDANIYLDGDYKGYSDYLTITTDSGSHDVKATRSDYDSETQSVDCDDGETVDVYLTLENGNGDHCDNGDCEECTFRIYAKDEDGDAIRAKIYIDGDFISDSDYTTETVDEGSHIVWVQKSGYISQDKEVECENGDTETIRFYLKKSECDEYDEDCYGEEAKVRINAINIYPEAPKLGEIVRGEVRFESLETFYLYQDVDVEIYVDGSLEKTERVRFNRDETLERIVSFAFNSEDYGVGSHTIEVRASADSWTTKKTKSFSIAAGEPKPQNCTDIACQVAGKHCLKIKSISLENPNVKVGETAKINVMVSNCGDLREDDVTVRLEDSIVETSDTFSINTGDEYEVAFDYEVGGEETLTLTAYDAYHKNSKSFRLKPETGYLSIYLDPSYTIRPREDNRITFKVKNIGVVTDTFDLSISDNIRPWVYGLADNVTLAPGEETTLQMTVNPGSSLGTYDFGITARTALSQKTVVSQLNVSEGFSWTGFFAMWGNYGWLWLLILIILILIVLFLIAREIRRRGKGGKKSDEERTNSIAREREEMISTRVMDAAEDAQEREPSTAGAYEWQRTALQAAAESRMAQRKKFWWDNDCVEYKF